MALCNACPIFARACGRVSIGGHPDKRPDSRLGKPQAFLTMRSAAGGETSTACSQQATRLKATTEWALVVSPAFHRRPVTSEGLFIIAGRADGFSPSNPRQHERGRASASGRVSIVRQGEGSKSAATGGSAAIGRRAPMTARIRDYLRNRREAARTRGIASSSTSTSCATTTRPLPRPCRIPGCSMP